MAGPNRRIRRAPLPTAPHAARPYFGRELANPQGSPSGSPFAPLPQQCDILVVGAGFAGLTAAHELAAGGADIVVIDERAPGRGSAVHGMGLAVPWPIEAPNRLLAALGVERGEALLRAVLEQLHHETGRGRIHLRATLGREDEELAQSMALLADLGATVQIGIDEQDGAGGTATFHAAIEGLVHDPMQSIRGLVQKAQTAGANIVSGCRVNNLHIRPDGAVDVQIIGADSSPIQPIRAELVVLACGAGARNLDTWAQANLLVQQRSAIGCGAPQDKTFPRPNPAPPDIPLPWSPAGFAARGYLSWRHADQELLIEGASFVLAEFGFGQDDDSRIDPKVLATLERFMPPGFQTVRWWSRTLSHGADGLPLVGPVPGRPRIVLLCGFGVDGALLGPPAARFVAHSLLNNQTQSPLAFLAPRRFL